MSTVGAMATGSPRDVVIDASVWVSRLLPQDVNHGVADSWVNRHIMSGGTFVAPTLLAIEISASVFRRTRNTTDARGAVSQLYALPIMRLAPMDQTLVNDATDLAATLGLRGPDAVYVALAGQLRIPLVSLDAEQLTLASVLVHTIRP
jgi:predicted nucleic acid-binding protein